jgi:hypothetical protein
MGLLDFIIRTEKLIDFSDNNIKMLTKLSYELGEILIKSGNGYAVDYLSQIRLSADNHDNEKFKTLVTSRELFGGSGAIWEIWIEDTELRKQFNKLFCDYIDLLKKMRIKSGRINQVRKYFDKLEND